MKNKFDLEKAKAGHEVECEGYASAKILDFEYRYYYYSNESFLAVKLRLGNGSDLITHFLLDGRSATCRPPLTMKPKVKRYWANVYKDYAKGDVMIQGVYKTEEKAKQKINAWGDYIDTISFPVKE